MGGLAAPLPLSLLCIPLLVMLAGRATLAVRNDCLHCPCAGKMVISNETSLYTVASAAIYGVILAVQAEYEEQPFRVTEMRLYAMFKRASGQWANLFLSCLGRLCHACPLPTARLLPRR